MKRALLLLSLFVAALASPSLAQLSGADIAGTWYREGDHSRPASVSGSGANLLFVNEFGQRARGHVSGPNSVVADDWEGGLTGIITDGGNTIAWANNTNWKRPAPSIAALNIAGTWYREGDRGKPASVSGSGANLLFVNEFGQSARGHVSGPNTVVADDWEGGLVGVITDGGHTIAWANNTNWRR